MYRPGPQEFLDQRMGRRTLVVRVGAVLDALFPLACPGCGGRGAPALRPVPGRPRARARPAAPPAGVDRWAAAFAYEGWPGSWWRGSSTATPGRWCRGWRRRWPSAPAPTGVDGGRRVSWAPTTRAAPPGVASTRPSSSPGPSPGELRRPIVRACSTASPGPPQTGLDASARRARPALRRSVPCAGARAARRRRRHHRGDARRGRAGAARRGREQCGGGHRGRARHRRDLPDTSLRMIPQRRAHGRSPDRCEVHMDIVVRGKNRPVPPRLQDLTAAPRSARSPASPTTPGASRSTSPRCSTAAHRRPAVAARSPSTSSDTS